MWKFFDLTWNACETFLVTRETHVKETLFDHTWNTCVIFMITRETHVRLFMITSETRKFFRITRETHVKRFWSCLKRMRNPYDHMWNTFEELQCVLFYKEMLFTFYFTNENHNRHNFRKKNCLKRTICYLRLLNG